MTTDLETTLELAHHDFHTEAANPTPDRWRSIEHRARQRQQRRRSALAACVFVFVAVGAWAAIGGRNGDTNLDVASDPTGHANEPSTPDDGGFDASSSGGLVITYPVGFAPTGRPEQTRDASGSLTETRSYTSEDGRNFNVVAYSDVDSAMKTDELIAGRPTSSPRPEVTVITEATENTTTVIATNGSQVVVVEGTGMTETELTDIAASATGQR